MKKAFGQTVRDLKREVNKKVLKVSGVEQKVLDATSNESWGPHGTHLADIAAASRNYHDYQTIMAVIWKRINDTGKNWRHVYKALVVLEYLVANGTERVIDEIREHAHQISTLADFQYIDSNGRDQGGNVRRKSQSLVMLVNDKERIAEVRQKASASRDKFRSSPGNRTGGNEDDRYSSRDEYGYGKDREGGYRDDERSSRNGDSYSRDGDRYSRESDERPGREGFRDDDYRDHPNGSRTRSVDGDRSSDNDGQYSDRGIDRKFSDQSIGGPPSYEEAVGESQSPDKHDRDQEAQSASIPKPSSSTVSSHASPTANVQSSPPTKQVAEGFDEFDPRVLAQGPAAATRNNNTEMDFLGSFSDSSAVMPTTSNGPGADAFASNSGFGATNTVQQSFDDPFGEDPFGDGPFKALPSDHNNTPAQPSVETLAASFEPNMNQNANVHQQTSSVPDFGFGDSFSGPTYPPSDTSPIPSHENSNPEEEIDILAGILPPTGPQTPFSKQSGQHLGIVPYGDFGSQGGPPAPATSQVSPHTDLQSQGNFYHNSGNSASSFSALSRQSDAGPFGGFDSQAGPTTSVPQQMNHQTQIGTQWSSNHGHYQQQAGHWPGQSNNNSYGDFGLQVPAPPTTSQISPPSQAGIDTHFNQGHFQHKIGTTTPFSAESQNGPSMHMNNGELALPAGPTVPVTSQTTQVSSAMGMHPNHGIRENQAGSSASPFSSESRSGQVMQPGSGDFGIPAGSTTSTGTSQASPQAQAGDTVPFNHENFQNQTGPSASPFSSQSQSAQALQPHNGNFGASPGLAPTGTTQMSPQAQAEMIMPFNHGNFSHTGPPSSQSQSGPTIQPNNMAHEAQAGMNMPYNHGNFPNQNGPSASQYQNEQARQPSDVNFGSSSGPTSVEIPQVPPQAQAGMNIPFNHGNFQNHPGPSTSSPFSASQANNGQPMPPNNVSPFQQHIMTSFSNGPPGGSNAGTYPQNMISQTPNGPTGHPNNFFQQQFSGPQATQQVPPANREMPGNMLPQTGWQQSQGTSQQPASSSAGPLAIVPQQLPKEKFQTKSTVWTDTLSRGLVDLNISGPKTNPLADIGVDFDTINRKEKRMEKQPATPVVSTITMGKAMGTGSGMGRAGATSLRPAQNPMPGNMNMGMGGMGSGGGHAPGMGMNMGMGGMGMNGGHGPGMGMGGMGMGATPGSGGGMGMGMGMGMGGMGGVYGGMNQQPMGMGVNSGYNNMGMGMNPAMGQGGVPMQQPVVGYNPMMGGNGYPQQPYGRGYR